MVLQFGEVMEGIGVIQFTGMNEAHVEIAHVGAILGLIKQTVLAMQNGLLQGPLTKRMPTSGLCRAISPPIDSERESAALIVAEAA